MTSPGGWERKLLISKIAIIYYLKYSVFNQKMRIQKQGKYMRRNDYILPFLVISLFFNVAS